ncbi:GtrA family protein [Parazoarcus communis]|uniref:GtrA family protein n=1 Tax=Parazoarcus communis TaxID=41977 RepID=UPI001403644D|nr:GtrA family protein [Parazoarcus communis]NMG70933.1 hypothetical protein [Parazoarcus communis SWub3 = DSM 12120]
MRDLRKLFRSARFAEVVRYLIAGTAITLAAHAVYLLALSGGIEPHPAWAVSFVFGTVIGYLIHRGFVFRVKARRRHWVSFPLAYGLRFSIGQGLLALLLALDMSAGWAGFVTNVAMAPIGFLLLKTVLRERAAVNGDGALDGGKKGAS